MAARESFERSSSEIPGPRSAGPPVVVNEATTAPSELAEGQDDHEPSGPAITAEISAAYDKVVQSDVGREQRARVGRTWADDPRDRHQYPAHASQAERGLGTSRRANSIHSRQLTAA